MIEVSIYKQKLIILLNPTQRPAIEEVLANIDLLSHGQFGNWCIQHICEHGAPHDKNRAIEHILLWSVDYSMDQFASKVIEKCLKIGGSEFLDRYLARVCTGRADRPRMPLIDSKQCGSHDPLCPHTDRYASCWGPIWQLFDSVDPTPRSSAPA